MTQDNISIIDKKCVGCFLCLDKCPTRAISKTVSKDGFEYPTINNDKCISCGICLKNCPVNLQDEKKYPMESFLTISKHKEEKNSSSGGLFYSIAKSFLEEMDGYVVGCVFDNNYEVKHILTNDIKDIYKMQGSKYVESSISYLYTPIKDILSQKKRVLFSGTPCQCSAMKKCFGNNPYFYCIDIVCHGVPSRLLWEKEIHNLQRKYKFSRISFRYKNKYEKTGYSLSLFDKDKLIKRIPYKKNGYYSLFINSKNFRKSCYSCEFAYEKRISDMTIGDCNTWLDYNDFYPEKSLSIALINTLKGKEIWDLVIPNIEFVHLNYEKEKKMNAQLSRPSHIENRLSDEELFKIINEDISLDKYAIGTTKLDDLKSIIKNLISVKTRENIRRLIK